MEKRQMNGSAMSRMQYYLDLYSQTVDRKYLKKAKQIGKEQDTATYEGYMFKD